MPPILVSIPSGMTRTVELGAFAHETLPMIEDASVRAPSRAAEEALRFYLEHYRGDDFGPDLRELRSASSPTVQVELELAGPLWDEVEARARQERADADAIVTSAVLAYVAALEAGRIANRQMDLTAPYPLAAGGAS